MTYVEEFKSLLAQEGGATAADRLLSAASVGLHVRKLYQSVSVPQKPVLGLFRRKDKTVRQGLASKPGASRIGGLPDLPEGFEWPVRKGKPAQFLMQINCTDIADFAAHTLSPSEGVLHFFYDFRDSELRRRNGEDAPPLVYHSPTATCLRSPSTTGPARAGATPLLPFPVAFVPIPSFPDGASSEFDALELKDQEEEAFFEAHAKWCSQRLECHTGEWGGLHQLGGHPQSVQGDVRADLDMVANGHYGSTDKKLWQEAERNAGQWRLLLQFDSDEDIGAMWGDAGKLYFGLREDDLRAKRFEKTSVVCQCY